MDILSTSITPAQPVLTVSQPAANAVVGLNTPFQITGIVTDRGGREPIAIDSVTVQIDSGPVIHAAQKPVSNKTLTEVSFHATAQITGGNDPHTVTVVATNDQQMKATRTFTVFTGQPFQVDAPAVLIDVLTLIPISEDDPQVRQLFGTVQRQLKPLSDALAQAGRVLIGPNLIVQPLSDVESRVRIGFWIEAAGFPVVPPSATFPLPRLSHAAALASLNAVPLLAIPNAGVFPSFAISVPVTTLQRLVDASTPALKSQAASQGFQIDTIQVSTSSPAILKTHVNGHILKGTIPASFDIIETVGLQQVAGGPTGQKAPAVLSTTSSSSVGSLLDWIAGIFVPEIGALLAYAFYKVSASASTKTGVAGSFLGSMPARIPFGNKAFTLPPDSLFQWPDFPSLDFFWNGFNADAHGLFGAGVSSIDARQPADVAMQISGPSAFTGSQATIVEFTDPVIGYAMQNIAPDVGQFGWHISGAGSNSGAIQPPNPAVQGGDINPHFPLPAKPSLGDYHFNFAVQAIETCQSDPTKTLTVSAAKAMTFHVKKGPAR